MTNFTSDSLSNMGIVKQPDGSYKKQSQPEIKKRPGKKSHETLQKEAHKKQAAIGTRLTFFSTLECVNVKRPVPEFSFHPVRKWRFDYAWPEQKIALEVEGGAFIGGRHTSGQGFVADMEKYNAAGMLGWRIFKCVPNDLLKTKTIQMLQKIIQ